MADWHDNDILWADMAAVIFNKQRMESAPKEVEQIETLLALRPGASVLDLCCGVGRHSLAFARRGHRATGVDRNERYLARARESAAEQSLDIEWVQSDMRAFRREGAFDAAVNLLTSFGYFEDQSDETRVLANACASLKPGAVFLMDIMSKEVLARIYRERDWHEEPDGTILLEERIVRDGFDWLDARWIVLREKERREHRFSLRLYSAAELRRLFTEAGLRGVRTYGGLDGRPYDYAAERLVVVGRKPSLT